MKTLRLILFFDCNFNCKYCCNNLPEVQAKFQYKSLKDINFSEYKAVCITGGEIFLRKPTLYAALDMIPKGIPIYLYTNGMELTGLDMYMLRPYKIQGINIGLHYPNQINNLDELVIHSKLVRFHIEDTRLQEFLDADITGMVSKGKVKLWTRDDCEQVNEDWVVSSD